MTHQEIIDRIERGPKGPRPDPATHPEQAAAWDVQTRQVAECAPLWRWVFEAPSEPRPREKERQGAWDVKTRRAGRLHPDAGHALSLLLGIDRKAIQAAKRWALEESRK